MVTRPLVVGRYAIYDKIASGGMASVHFGRLTSSMGFTRTVAVKRLHPHLVEDAEFLRALLDEARLAARIHHPNVVPTIDVVATDTDLLVVMEYVRGESLAELLRRPLEGEEERPSLPIVSAIAVGVLQGLHAAHEATSEQGTPLGIVHRDVSPQNILVGVDGAARVIDFGVAKAAGRLQTTREGVVKGKISYMAPEQLGGDLVTPRTDTYAMAVVLWEMLTGRKLFQGDDRPSLFGRVLAGVHAPPSRYATGLPAGLDELVMKGLSLDPESRLASAREMAEALARLVPPSLPTEVAAWVRRVASKSLLHRAALLAAIESDSGSVSAQHDEDARASISRLQRAPTEDAGAGVSTVVHVAPPKSGSSLPIRSRRIVAVGAAAVVVLAFAATLAVRRQPSRRSAQPEGTAAAPTVAGHADDPPLQALPSPTGASTGSAAAAPVDPGASARPAAPAPSGPPVPPSRPRAAGKPGRAPATGAPSAARDCNPNFVYDSAGQMVFKPECFR